jgi:hypothetical protein
MRPFLALAICLLVAGTAAARPVRVWTYEDLFKEADVVAIVRVTEVRDTAARLEGYGDTKLYQGKEAEALVGLMLKGDRQPKLTFQFFSYAPKVSPLPNGAMFADLSGFQKSHYLVFLKKLDDGTLVPISGHFDAGSSVRALDGEGLIELRESRE